MVYRAIAAAAAGAALAAAPVVAQCNVILVATGTYQLEVKSGGPYPVVDFKRATNPIWRLTTRGSMAQCDDGVSGSIDITKSRNASDLLFHVANELRAAAENEWASGQRPTRDFPYRDFVTLADEVRANTLMAGLRRMVSDIAADLIKRYANPASYFTDKGAQWIAERAVEMMLQEYVEGRDPGLIIDGQLGRMVDYLKSQAGTLTQQAGNPALEGALKQLLNEIAKELKKLLVEELPTEQWIRAESTANDCTHALHISWEFKGGGYRATLTIQCGPQQPDWVASVVVVAPPVKPGQAGTVTVQALNQLGVAFPLSTATITGLAAVMPDGSTEPNAVVAGRTASFNYTAAKPRRDGKFALVIDVVTDRSTGLLTGHDNAEVVVENVAPVIESVTPGSASAEPGESLELRGARVLVVDDNADSRNAGEVSVRSLRLVHPGGLRITPRFDRADNPRQVSFDAGSGHYVFEFDRIGQVAEPHEHGTWSAPVSMADVDGEEATSSVSLEVEDTPPLVARIVATPEWVHAGDGLAIAVTARFSDKNGADDIESFSIDASLAGGALYTIGNGLTELERGADYIEVRLTQPFAHTDAPGPHDIIGEAKDEANTGTDKDVIHVGNEVPVIRGTGFIRGGDPVTVAETDIAATAPKHLCPNDPFRVGLILADLEGDALTATVTIVETGQTLELHNSSPNIWIGDLRAPPAPGTYTLLFKGSEKPPLTHSVEARHTLIVHPCPGSVSNNAVLIASPVNPDDVATAPRDPGSQVFFGAFGGATVARGTSGGSDRAPAAAPDRAALDELFAELDIAGRPLDPGASPPQQAPQVEAYLLALGGSTGPVVQFFAINRSGQTVQLPAAGLVLEPVQITPAAQTRITSLLQGFIDRGGAPETVNAYCLEFLRQPPAAGMVLRIAGDALQRQFARQGRVLDAVSRLRELGRLAPDSDPEDYFHAIRQWAVWTVEERFDPKRFEDAFVQVTQRNYQAAGEAWTDDVEKALRSLAPNRWNDVQAVLREAGLEAGR